MRGGTLFRTLEFTVALPYGAAVFFACGVPDLCAVKRAAVAADDF